MLAVIVFIIFLTISGYLLENRYIHYFYMPYLLAKKPNKYIKHIENDIIDANYSGEFDNHEPAWPNNNRYVYPYYSESYLKHPYYDREFMEYSGLPKPFHLLEGSSI